MASALIAAERRAEPDPAGLTVAVALTLLVLWLAHVYTRVLEHGLLHGPRDAGIVREAMVRELAIVEAPLPSLAVLLLAPLGLVSDRVAVTLALGTGIVQLWAWGVAAGRALGRSWPGAAVGGLVDAGLGLAVIALESLLH